MAGLTLIASYPKSGNTWLRAILESLRRDGAPVALNRLGEGASHIAWRFWFDTMMGVEASDLTDREVARSLPDLHRRLAHEALDWPLFKVHDARRAREPDTPMPFPAEAVAAVLYVVRDPRDVAVSFAHFMSKTVDETIAHMADPRLVLSRSARQLGAQLPQFLSSWSAHVESWLDAPDLRVHMLRYEDMLASPQDSFAAALRFAGIDAAPTTLAAAIAAARFETLQAQETAEGFRESPPGIDRFFRRGITGGWRDSLTPAQAERIEHDHGTVMRRLGYLA